MAREHFPSYRKIGGKRYQLNSWFSRKIDATDAAARSRKGGASARVVKDKFASGKPVYLVYTSGK